MVVISIPAGISKEVVTTAFASCVDTKSTIMLEFQGVVEMDGHTWAGNALGQLSILDGGLKAQLVIGNHRLDGKVLKLDKPLLLIQKKNNLAMNTDVAMKDGNLTTDIHKYKIENVNDLDQHNQSSIRPLSPPKLDEDDTMTSTGWGDDVETSSTPTKPMAAGTPEVIEYDTVAIIRQKILFNTMPTPIIHTDRRGLTVIKRGV
ncbi:hypothetical protein BCR41DRAFT_361108 [Lobosporangium transversale]|uniref:Uncharacterized protein n=1 Tax=Lobosporangium transversale TaxID=64571 RepID=A0A1Y2GBJ1_9FUNG|nr:hypothetical protein BCR41DRAFT_361108 [Lobosporangium transversale]ORZ06345.1 hypothetical protein BCR41DRAFT_361108 [Lobosporangium transversale]|eukprot:XP_021877508.1 hypothetical protein BCR41DRAFT_361108 [Lobosporangium transversale]